MAEKISIPSLNSLFNGAVFVSAKTIAIALDTSETTVWRWAKSGKLPQPHRLSEGTTRWRTDELCAALTKPAAERLD